MQVHKYNYLHKYKLENDWQDKCESVEENLAIGVDHKQAIKS